MQFIRYRRGARSVRLGVRDAGGVRDLRAAYERYRTLGGAPDAALAKALRQASLRALIAADARAFHEFLRAQAMQESERVPEEAVTLQAPLHDPGRVIGIGLNYRDHAREVGQEVADFPPLFAKWTNSLTGPFDPIPLPPDVTALDYEVELGIVIGRRACRVAPEEALAYVFGYTVINDVSARDRQFRTSQWLAGKIGDGFAPLGPAVTERQDLGDPLVLELKTWVNGELRQAGHTRDMVHGVAALVSGLSELLTLEPGDLIASGTPAGVGMSAKPPRYLRSGDLVRMEITGLGAIENRVL